MTVIFIDYSELYYQHTAETAVPEKRNGKFVQIRNNDNEYLVFSPKELAPFHSDIVKRFCMEKGIGGAFDDERKRFIISDPAWTVIGGGKFELDTVKKRLRLYDNSMAYGKFDAKGLAGEMLRIRQLDGYDVMIE